MEHITLYRSCCHYILYRAFILGYISVHTIKLIHYHLVDDALSITSISLYKNEILQVFCIDVSDEKQTAAKLN